MEMEEEQDISGETSERQKLLDDTSSMKTFIKPTRCNDCTFIIEPLLVLNMFFLNPLFVIMPQYIERREWEKLMGNETFPASSNSCQSNANSTDNPILGNLTLAGSATSYFNVEYMLTGSIPSIFAVLFLGPYSDKAGRRFALVLPAIGHMLGMFIYFIVVWFHLPVELILVGSFVVSLFGGWNTLFLGALAFITDVTTQANRSFRMVGAEVCLMVPTILSSVVSGYVIELMGFTWIFFIFLLCSILAFLYVVFLVPETVHRQQGVKFFSTDHIKKAFTTFAFDDRTKRRWKLLLLLFIFFLYTSVFDAAMDTFFMMNLPLCWGSVTIGIYYAIFSSVSVAGSGVCSKLLSFCLSDAWVIAVAIFTGVVDDAFKFFVTTNAMMFRSTVFNLMGSIFAPTIRSLMSKLVSPDETGAVFSGVAVVEVVCGMIGSSTLNPFYSVTAEAGHPSAVYLFEAAVLLVCFTMMVFYAIYTHNDTKRKQAMTEAENKIA